MGRAKEKGIRENRADWLEAGHLLGEGKALYFTLRRGGVSPPPYDTLNLSGTNGDEPRNVLENRSQVAGWLGLELRDMVFMRQVHGTEVRRVSEGGALRERVVPGTDGLFTTRPGLALVALTADCVPLALGFESPPGVAMLHAGWRGTVGDIVGEALKRLSSLGAQPGEFRAVIGPCIGPCCYSVDEGRARLFVEKYGERSGVVKVGDGYRLDLALANRINLLRAGVEEENIHRVGGCTCCREEYFSFRREGVTGRQGALVMLLPPPR